MCPTSKLSSYHGCTHPASPEQGARQRHIVAPHCAIQVHHLHLQEPCDRPHEVINGEYSHLSIPWNEHCIA